MVIRPIRFSLAHIGSVCLAAVLSAAIVASFYNTLNQIENRLPDFGFFSIRELNVAIHDISHLQDMVTLARLAPWHAESAERLAEANDLVYIRFTRQDQSQTIRGYPEYGQAVVRAGAVVRALDTILAQGLPLPVGELELIGRELASIEIEMTEAYYAFGQSTNMDLAEIQQRLGQLNIQTAVVLSVFSALAIGVAVLLVNRHRTLRSLRHLAWHDPLTGLKNRAWLLSNADRLLLEAKAADKRMSLFLIDIDLFKEVNDTFGHQTGDAMLRTVGTLLANVETRNSGYAVRLGGDEFAMLLPNLSVTIFERVLGELRDGLNALLDLNGIQIRMSASIGIAHFPEHAADLDALLRHADYALYAAKGQGGATTVVFSHAITGHIESQLRLDEAIRKAIVSEELFLDWQPQYELASGKLSGAEALVRWRDPATAEIVSPADFIPAAERSELILEIDRFVLAKACRQAAEWSATAPPGFTFSVNISAKHLQRPELSAFVREQLELTGLDPTRLELEITESAFIENKETALEVLVQLKKLGVRVALDDFGSGYSSLSYLVDLQVTRIKIDRSFISGLTTSLEKRSVIEAIMALAHSLDLNVVAEGVETSEQTAFLMRLGCQYAQGFLLSRPISAAEMALVLAEKKWVTPELIEGARRILAA